MAGKRLPQDEVNRRVGECYHLRFHTNEGLKYSDWVKYCHKNYNDKSELMYTQYWSTASKMYEEKWKEKLNKFLDPAVDRMITLLEDENPKIALEAAKMFFKYTGNEVTRIEGNVTTDVIITFGSDETLTPDDEE